MEHLRAQIKAIKRFPLFGLLFTLLTDTPIFTTYAQMNTIGNAFWMCSVGTRNIAAWTLADCPPS